LPPDPQYPQIQPPRRLLVTQPGAEIFIAFHQGGYSRKFLANPPFTNSLAD
jgi:hypothetical protein